jgi:hypothetical protein
MNRHLLSLFGALVILVSLLSGDLKAQNSNDTPVTVSIHGFAKADVAWDSRQVVEAREGFLVFYPQKPKYDAQGEDINATPGFNSWAMTSRVNIKATGPKVLGATAMAFVEGDFTGPSNTENNAFRLRHAYVSLAWEKWSVLAGQYWNPMDVPEMLPKVLALNTGAPFRSFTRSPMVKAEYKFGSSKIIAAIYTQRDYQSSGPSGASANYLRTSGLPNFHLQYQLNRGSIIMGIGADYKMIRPRMTSDSLIIDDNKVSSFSALAYIGYSKGKFGIKGQALYGQNLSDHLMLGGYAVSSIDPTTDAREYVNLNNLSSWIDCNYRITPAVNLGLFAGYSQNLGTEKDVVGAFYGRGDDIASLYRLSPRIEWIYGPVQFIAEVEYTAAAFGKPDNRYKFDETETTNNLRVQTALVYNF